jgi:hypothetical protein
VIQSLRPGTDAAQVAVVKKISPVRHPPQSGWLDELDRLKGGWLWF